MLIGVELGPVQLGAPKGLRVLRIGDLLGVPPVIGEFVFAAFGGGAGQLGFRVGAEELERSRRSPL